MTTIWGAITVGALSGVMMLIRWWRYRARLNDMGSVSHQWISEQRLGQQGQDPRR